MLEERSIPTDVVNALENLFPVQLNMYNEKPLREEMVQVAAKLEATVYVIGDIKEGVAEEVALYEAANLPVIQIALDVEK